jgi:hypothetical protein
MQKQQTAAWEFCTTKQNVHWMTNKTTINPLTPNGHYSGRTAPLISRRCILNIYSKNIRTEYFKDAA